MDNLQIGLLAGGSLSLVGGLTGALTGAYFMVPSLSVAGTLDPVTGGTDASIGTQYLGTFKTPWYTGSADLMTRLKYNYAIYTGKPFAAYGIQPPGQCVPADPAMSGFLDPGFTGLPSAWGCLNAGFNLLSIVWEDGLDYAGVWRLGSPDVPDYMMAVGALALLLAWWRRTSSSPALW